MIKYLYKYRSSIIIIFVVSLIVVSSCRKDPVLEDLNSTELKTPLLPEELFDYETESASDYFLNDPVFGLFNVFEQDNITNEGATLGRVLFYDVNLSDNNTVSCASCHKAENAFSDPSQFSEGLHGEFTSRNSMGIFNLRYNRRFFWDARALSLEQQALMPIENSVEMGMDLDQLVIKLNEIDYYKDLFSDAFGNSVINEERIADALAMFVRSIQTYNSDYDQGLINEFADFTESENNGKEMYFSGDFRCNHCHRTANFGGIENNINGLEYPNIDEGMGGLSGDEDDIGRFKAPSLRNIGMTAPYMHDGRFATLDDVMNFYSTDIQAHPYLDDRLAIGFEEGGTPIQFEFTDQQKADMIAFLMTLSDEELFLEDRFSDPFDH